MDREECPYSRPVRGQKVLRGCLLREVEGTGPRGSLARTNSRRREEGKGGRKRSDSRACIIFHSCARTYIVAPANDNEKKHAPSLLDKTVEATKGRVRTVVADPQYSSGRFREKAAGCGVEAVIPYPRNQRRGENVLRVDKRFRAHGPEREVRIYGRARSSIERVNSRLEELVCLDRHRVRGLRNVTVHVALCIIALLLVAVAALRLGVPEKVRCVASFGWG